MADNSQKALSIFRSGMNCAQAVLTAFSEDIKFDNCFALEVSNGFGGGMGRLQETCGAVTGAFMVLGIYNSRKHADSTVRKDNTNAMIQEFNKRFLMIHKTTNCRLLLGVNMQTTEGLKFMSENKLREIVCEKCILSSVSILKELFK